MSLHYELRHGEYALIGGRGDIVFSTHEVAVAYDTATAMLLKHGPREAIDAWAARIRKGHQSAGPFVEAATIAVLSSRRWDVEQLNRIISTSGSLKSFLADLKPATVGAAREGHP